MGQRHSPKIDQPIIPSAKASPKRRDFPLLKAEEKRYRRRRDKGNPSAKRLPLIAGWHLRRRNCDCRVAAVHPTGPRQVFPRDNFVNPPAVDTVKGEETTWQNPRSDRKPWDVQPPHPVLACPASSHVIFFLAPLPCPCPYAVFVPRLGGAPSPSRALPRTSASSVKPAQL